MSTSPNDEERDTSIEEGRVPSRIDTAHMQTSEVDYTTQLNDNSFSEGNVPDLNISSDGYAPIFRSNLNIENGQSSVRRFSRSGKMPAKFNDYVVESNVKYGLEKHVNYSKLDNNWVEAMDNEIEALNRNNTWTITDLPAGRKPIGWWKLSMQVEQHGFKQSKFDYSLYIKQTDNMFIALLVYVDDIVITGNHQAEIDVFKMFLSIVASVGLLTAKPVATPLPENYVLSYQESETDKLLTNITEYQKLVEDKNPIRTLRDYSKPSHGGYKNTIELPIGNNVVPLRSNTIWLVKNGCSFHGLRSEDPNKHLKDFLKRMDSLDLDGENRERKRMHLLQFSLRDASNWLERLPAGSITTWEDLTTNFLA
ncbi:zinc finger, CCHC-type containing protein [Tanacetum coccineum]